MLILLVNINFYWDTRVFIDWLMSSHSSRTPEEMNGINEIAQLVEANKAILQGII